MHLGVISRNEQNDHYWISAEWFFTTKVSLVNKIHVTYTVCQSFTTIRIYHTTFIFAIISEIRCVSTANDKTSPNDVKSIMRRNSHA